MSAIGQRVDRLEDAVIAVARSSRASVRALSRSHLLTESGLRDLGSEMRGFKDGVLDFKDEMRGFKNEMLDFKDEMQSFKNEMLIYRRQANQEWGRLANRLGSLVEDLIQPALPVLVEEWEGRRPEHFGINLRRRLAGGREREYDAMAAVGNHLYVASIKSVLHSRDVDRFVAGLGALRLFFPEYEQYRLIGVLAAPAVEMNVVKRAEKRGLYCLAIGLNLMDVQNTKGFQPKLY